MDDTHDHRAVAKCQILWLVSRMAAEDWSECSTGLIDDGGGHVEGGMEEVARKIGWRQIV